MTGAEEQAKYGPMACLRHYAMQMVRKVWALRAEIAELKVSRDNYRAAIDQALIASGCAPTTGNAMDDLMRLNDAQLKICGLDKKGN